MMNFIYHQIAMYYLRKAHKVPVMNVELWLHYMSVSRDWMMKIKAGED